MSKTKIAIPGIAGRMGLALVRELRGKEDCVLLGGTEREGAPGIGRDVGELAGIGANGLKVVADPLALFAEADVVIDFTAPAALLRHAELAAQAKAALIVGTTGLEDEHFEALHKASRHAAIVQSFNMSLGVNILAGLVRQAARTLDDAFDIEIVEMHHRMKVDAPSGTAILLGEAAAEGRGISLKDRSERGRDGITGARKTGAIGFASLRGGNVAGEHTVMFAADNERIELTHRATDRNIFARGAVHAARWAKGKAPGLYTMADVLGLK